MVEIEYKGANSLVISSKKAKIVIDPKLSLAGLKDLSVKDAIELLTEDRFAVKNIDSDLVIHGPGEYGVEDFDIKAVAAQRHIDSEKDRPISTMYRIEVEDIRLGVVGNIAANLSDDQLEELGVLDVLIIPVGGNGYTLDGVEATKLVGAISPKVVIPIHYADDKVKYEVPQDELADFEKAMGKKSEETVAKYKIKQIPADKQNVTKIVQITRS